MLQVGPAGLSAIDDTCAARAKNPELRLAVRIMIEEEP
jgi:hypothetical protein